MVQKLICKVCNIEKLVDDFYWKNKSNNKKHSACKICSEQKRKNKEHYEKYKIDYLNRSKNRRSTVGKQNKIKAYNYLKNHPCKCGVDNPIVLEFHHINKKRWQISKMLADYNWETILSEIKNCEVMCANCHKIETAKQFNWFKYNL